MATFTNQATLTYNGGTASSNITTGELLEVLTATKTAVVPTYRSGRPITYLITLVNAGTADLTGLTVADDLGGYTINGAPVYPQSYPAGSPYPQAAAPLSPMRQSPQPSPPWARRTVW